MTDLQNRTLICSVLFLDIVEYSQKAVAEQIALKDRLNTLLSEALRGVALNDRIILDTGDGAAISFIGDPEDALFVATALRDAIQAQPNGPLATRMGINLGPVRLVKDINGRPNVIGDGINVAQRVMTFADPGQVLVSRSYYEVVSRLSEETSKLFSYEGARTDKHIREHEVYAVGAVQPARRLADAKAAVKEAPAPQPAALARATGALRALTQPIVRSPPLATALTVAAILMFALVVRASREPPDEPPSAEAPIAVPKASVEAAKPPQRPEPERRADAKSAASVPWTSSKERAAKDAKVASREAAEATAPVPSTGSKERAAKDVKTTPAETAAPPAPVPQTASKERAAKDANTASRETGPSSAGEKAVGKTASAPPREEVAETKVAAAAAPATLTIAVAPWGEVHIDGKMQGVSPPLQEIQLAPGKHRIELRNSGAQAHVVNVDAKPGERIRIKHKFK
jgi:class 3 adenylate cyclase